jgi:hypothetical protein
MRQIVSFIKIFFAMAILSQSAFLFPFRYIFIKLESSAIARWWGWWMKKNKSNIIIMLWWSAFKVLQSFRKTMWFLRILGEILGVTMVISRYLFLLNLRVKIFTIQKAFKLIGIYIINVTSVTMLMFLYDFSFLVHKINHFDRFLTIYCNYWSIIDIFYNNKSITS